MSNEESKYEFGQIWKYKNREGEDDSRVYICQVDDTNYVRVYHLHVTNVKLPGNDNAVLGHTPVNAKTLDASLTEMVDTTEEVPDISEGYRAWKSDFRDGRAGVFEIPIHEIVNIYDQLLQQQNQTPEQT